MITVLLLLGLFFHTNVALEDWLEDWLVEADGNLSPELITELRDMQIRHPYWGDPPPVLHSHPVYSRSYSYSVEQWRPLVAKYFTATKVETAMCILGYETGFTGDPNSKNTRSSAAGLFQFLKGTWDSVPRSVTGGSYDSGKVYEPEANVRAAAWLQENAGWTQWSPYNRGLCRGL